MRTILKFLLPKKYRPSNLPETLARGHGAILSGPFQGMRYGQKSCHSAWLPKILGTYELELHPFLQVKFLEKHNLIVDVGCAEGYYACGFGRMLPQTQIIAFDMDPNALHEARQNLMRNDVRNVTLKGLCNPIDLDNALSTETTPFLLMDCEGAESTLLTPNTVPSLKKTTILVELHDFIDPHIPDLLRKRFQATHHIQTIHELPREKQHFPTVWWKYLHFINKPGFLGLMQEWRPAVMQWWLLIPM